MEIKISTLVFSVLIFAVNCLPPNLYLGTVALPSKRQVNHGMLITGYYGPQGNERSNGFNYEPRLNVENDCKTCGGEQIVPLGENISNVEGSAPEIIPLQEAATETVETPTKLTETAHNEIQKPKKPATQSPGSSEENDDSWPAVKPQLRAQQPFFNFFPIMFGGYDSLGRSRGAPGGATAIANSFSTGKGGVATSSATAYGDTTSYLRNGKRW